MEYRFELASYDAFIRADYSYVSGYFSNLLKIGPESGDYKQLHLKAGVSIADVNVDLFVNNLTDSDAFSGTEQFFGGNRVFRLRPRTLGLNVSYSF